MSLTVPATAPSSATPKLRGPDYFASGSLTVVAWDDPLNALRPGSIPTASADMLVFWSPVLGPLGALLIHRFAGMVGEGPTTWALDELTRTFGIGRRVSRLTLTLQRLECMDLLRRDRGLLGVRTSLPPLSRRQLAKLPAYLIAAYQAR